MGIASSEDKTPGSIPKIALVSPSLAHKTLSGQTIEEAEVDLVVRGISVGQPHRAIPITVAMSLAAASRIEGSVVQRNTSSSPVDSNGLTLGHSSGKLLVEAHFDGQGVVKDAIVFRTARELMRGTVYWK